VEFTQEGLAGLSINDQNTVTVTNNIIARNIISSTPYTAGGVYLNDSIAEITNKTITANDGDGLLIDDVNSSTIYNNIISGNGGTGWRCTTWVHPPSCLTIMMFTVIQRTTTI
jgi:hypothetical protein